MGSDTAAGFSRAYQAVAMLTGGGARKFRSSVWLKANTGTPTVTINAHSGSVVNGQSVTLGSSWVRVTSPVNTGLAADTFEYIMLGALGTALGATAPTASIDILVWGAQLEEISGQSNQNPGEYISVGVTSAPYHGANVDGVKYFATKNGNTVASGVITEAVGAAINTANGASSATCTAIRPLGFLKEIRSDTTNFTTETGFNGWTKTNVTVTELNAVSPAGDTTAALLTENATNAGHLVNTSGTISGTDPIFSVFVKAATRTQCQLRVGDTGANFVDVAFDLSGSGSILIAQSASGTATARGAGIIAYPGGWFRVYSGMSFVSLGSGIAVNIYAMNGGVLSYTGNSSAALYLWGSTITNGGFDTMPRSYSFRAGSRGADALTYPFASNASATAGTVYAEVKSQWSSALDTYPVVAFGTSPNFPLYAISGDAATTIRTNDGTTSVQKTGLSSSNTAMRKRAASWTGSVLAVTGDGLTAATGTFDGNMGSTAIGIGQPTTATGVNWSGNISNVKIYTTAATAAQLQR